jgi:hypothetical protein
MSTEQSTADSGDSIESRLNAVFAADETDTPEVVAEDTPAPVDTETTETDEQVSEPESDEDTIDWQADDGTQVKVPAVLKDSLLRQQDYTKKTMLVAELHKQAEDRLQYAEAREQISTAVLEDVTQLRQLQTQLKQYQDADWAAIYDANPGQALRAQQQMRQLEQQVQQKQGEIQAKAQHFQRATSQHRDVQWSKAEAGAMQMIGKITQQENIAMAQTLKSLAISDDEFKQRFADPRIIAAVHKAAKWDMLQASKPGAVQSASKAPPVVKPGASKGPGVAAEQRYRDTRQQLRKSGSVDDAAKLMLLRMK